MQIFDLTQLRDVINPPVVFSPTARYAEISSAHNVAINEETGFAYIVGANDGGVTCGGGLHMVDIQDPLQPAFAGCFQDTATGRVGTVVSSARMPRVRLEMSWPNSDSARRGWLWTKCPTRLARF